MWAALARTGAHSPFEVRTERRKACQVNSQRFTVAQGEECRESKMHTCLHLLVHTAYDLVTLIYCGSAQTCNVSTEVNHGETLTKQASDAWKATYTLSAPSTILITLALVFRRTLTMSHAESNIASELNLPRLLTSITSLRAGAQ